MHRWCAYTTDILSSQRHIRRNSFLWTIVNCNSQIKEVRISWINPSYWESLSFLKRFALLSPTFLWDIAQELEINFFGTSAKYLSTLHKLEVDISKTHNLKELRTIGSTGSPLMPETFDYIWKNISATKWLLKNQYFDTYFCECCTVAGRFIDDSATLALWSQIKGTINRLCVFIEKRKGNNCHIEMIL